MQAGLHNLMPIMMRARGLFVVAGLWEMGGGYFVWQWLRERRGLWLGVIGFVLLSIYGVLSTLREATLPFGGVCAVYGAVFIALALF